MSATLFGLVKFTNIPGSKRAIMWVLADHANDQGECWPNRATLAAEVGIGEKPLRDNLKSLEQEGWIRMELGNGRGNPTRYFLNISRLRAEAANHDMNPASRATKDGSKKDLSSNLKGGSERVPFERGVSDKGGHLEPIKGGTSFPKGWYPTFNEPSRTIIEPPVVAATAADEGSALMRYWQDCTGQLMPAVLLESLDAMLEEGIPSSWIRDAMTETAESSVKNFKYTKAILDRWKRDGRQDTRDKSSGSVPPPPTPIRWSMDDPLNATNRGKPREVIS